MNKTLSNKFVIVVLALMLMLTSSTTACAQGTIPSDIENHWAKATLEKAIDNGWISGYPDGTLRPDNPITRAEFVALFNQVFIIAKVGENALFSDVSPGDWYFADVNTAKTMGILSGYPDGTFGPMNPISRQEACVIITNYLGIINTGNAEEVNAFSDSNQIASWAVLSVAAAKGKSIIGGFPDGTFGPETSITRAQALVMLSKALEYKTNAETITINNPSPQNPQTSPSTPNIGTSSAGGGGGGGGGGSSPSTPDTSVDDDIAALTIGFADGDDYNCVTKNITLIATGANGSTIIWKSDNSAILEDNGTVHRPGSSETSVEVSLTATVSKGGVTKTKSFTIKIIKDSSAVVLKDNSISDLTTLNSGTAPDILTSTSTGIPEFIDGCFSPLIVECPEDAIHSLNSVKTILNIGDPQKEFVLESMHSLDGFSSYRLQQVWNGVPVYGKQVIICTDPNGNITALSSGYRPNVRMADIDINPTVTSSQAEDIAIKFIGDGFSLSRSSELIIYADDIDPKLAWGIPLIGANSEEGLLDCYIYVDAQTGSILGKTTYGPSYSVVPGRGLDYFNNVRTFNVEKPYPSLNSYVMQDTSHKIITYTANYRILPDEPDAKSRDGLVLDAGSNGPYKITSSNKDSWDTVVTDEQSRAAVSAYANTEAVYKYYKDNFKWTAFDNGGKEIDILVNYGDKYDNAFHLMGNLYFGDGNGSSKICYAAGLDVVGHEYTHGVEDNTAKWPDVNQYGALKEAYSDIIGNCIENDGDSVFINSGKEYEEWLWGEDICPKPGDALRSLSDPNTFECSAKIGDKYYVYPVIVPKTGEPANDKGGVHTNCGIIDKAAYLIWRDTGISKVKLAKIFFESLRMLESDSGYVSCRYAVIKAAKKEGLDEDKIRSINNAFDTVSIKKGVYNDLDKNAWYYKDFKKALDHGLISGYPDGSVKPAETMTNAEFIKLLINAYYYDRYMPTTITIPWKGHWAEEELQFACKNGWIVDKENFDPDAKITRQEAGFYIWQAFKTIDGVGGYLKLKVFNESEDKWKTHADFNDQELLSDKYEPAIWQLYRNGIITGYPVGSLGNKCLKPLELVDRATCATLVMRTFK